METELISVIVPVYNVERYLRRCVDSILHQTYRNLEVLLVDDGSTAASGAICDEYAAQEARVTAVRQKNGGLSAARNAGLERAQGTYLCFVDSDDFLDSRMLETLCRDLQEQDADAAAVGFRMFEREEELAPAELAVPVQCMTGREAIRSTLVSDELGDFAWNKLYKRELFRDDGGSGHDISHFSAVQQSRIPPGAAVLLLSAPGQHPSPQEHEVLRG